MAQFIALAVIAIVFALWLVARRGRPAGRATATIAEPPKPARPSAGQPSNAKPAAPASLRETLLGMAAELGGYYSQSAHPTDLLANDDFKTGVDLIVDQVTRTPDLLAYYNGDNAVLACMALEAWIERGDPEEDLAGRILATQNSMHPWVRWFALRLLSTHGGKPLIGRVLSSIDDSWENRFCHLFLLEFVERQVEAGEAPTFGDHLSSMDAERKKRVESLLSSGRTQAVAALRGEIAMHAKCAIDVPYLSTVGRVWGDRECDGVVSHARLESTAAELIGKLTGAAGDAPAGVRPRRSVLLAGPTGAGKTALVRHVARKLRAKGFTIFEASAADVIAGQTYIGELEGRIQKLLAGLGGGKPVIWIVPRFHELIFAGRHRYSPTSILDLVLPAIESGHIQVVGEVQPGACDRLLRTIPRLRAALDVIRVDALPDAETLSLARDVLVSTLALRGTAPDDDVLREAIQLAAQYLGDREAPGRVLDLLARAVETTGESRGDSVDAGTQRTVASLGRHELMLALSRMTGLPASILDERATLDLKVLRAFFAGRVIGQDEAIQCLVDRVAMVKAGLSDPKRPVGVFLFTGPTGTGKTELAKSLAEYLFGSPERMLRYDMSEFQSEESLARLVGEGDEAHGQEALVDRIRNQPFAVVLLDEFDKAHPRVFDLFLQLFDDGRLTDRRGNTADFRHAIIIMTSNLGGDSSREGSVGFRTDGGAGVKKAISAAFRKEFINRIDRVVVFQPLARPVMREILMKELNDVLGRRGLRNRTWAVEWEPSAIEFLLDKGFTEDLGARPLKRAIEQWLLAPLATTIVDHQVPQGDQFLFVRSDGERLDVVFVDPDAPEPGADRDDRDEADGGGSSGIGSPASTGMPALEVKEVAREARGERREVEFLGGEMRRLEGIIRGDAWKSRKTALYDAMGGKDFWRSGERFKSLGLVEYMDRLEVGFDSAESLHQRLSKSAGGGGETRQRLPAPLAAKLAHEVYLLDEACRGIERDVAPDAWIEVTAAHDSAADRAAADAFAARLAAMYLGWVKQRRMRVAVLDEPSAAGASRPYRWLAAISGFAAFPILEAEHGLHVFESGGDERRPIRHKAHVRVIAQPHEPPPSDLAAHAALASECIARPRDQLRIVRRYREEPSPLVRDAVRGWRTGRIDRVLAGEFDLF